MPFRTIQSFIKRHLSTQSGLGTYLLLTLSIILVAVGAFVYLAEDVATNDSIVQFDSAVVNAVHVNTTPMLVQLMLAISMAGSQLPIVVTVSLALYFLWQRRGYDLLLLVLALGGSQVVNELLKRLFHRPRPSFTDPLTSAVGFSFPSGHAMGALVFYGLLAYLILRDTKPLFGRIAIFIVFMVIVGLVGLSRIYLGVHYPSDVVGGYGVGVAWLVLSIMSVRIFYIWRQEKHEHMAEL